jgi:hypothetical protein
MHSRCVIKPDRFRGRNRDLRVNLGWAFRRSNAQNDLRNRGRFALRRAINFSSPFAREGRNIVGGRAHPKDAENEQESSSKKIAHFCNPRDVRLRPRLN